MNWAPPPSQWPLGQQQAHLWTVSFDVPDSSLEALKQLLDPGERAQADRFHFERDRRAYVVTHGVLRRLLGSYLHVAAEHFEFSRGSHGKPQLSAEDLKFNIAHTRGMALLGFCRRAEIGVDIEWQGRETGFQDVIERYFTPNEQKDWGALSGEDRVEGFFQGWTRKEAILKACGRGLSIAPERIEVSVTPGDPARVLSTPEEITPTEGWALWDLRPASGYIGALALPGEGWHISTWRYRLETGWQS